MVVMNPYFQSGDGIGNRSEQRLFEDLIIEGLKIYGNLIYYIPRVLVSRDLVLGEDNSSKFKNALAVEMYFETTEGFLPLCLDVNSAYFLDLLASGVT
jgi:hypothetical protein